MLRNKRTPGRVLSVPEMDQVTEKDQPKRPSDCQLPEARKRLK